MTLAIGVDVGGTKVLAAAIDPTDPTVIVVSQRVPTPLGGPAIVEAITAAARQVLDDVRRQGARAGGGGRRRPARTGRPRRRPAGGPQPPRWGGCPGAEAPRRTRSPSRSWSTTTPTARRGPRSSPGPGSARPTSCSSPSARGSAEDSWSGVGSTTGPTASPASRATWWSTRTGPCAPVAAADAGSATPRGAGLAWLARQAAGRGAAPGLIERAGGEVGAIHGEHVRRRRGRR